LNSSDNLNIFLSKLNASIFTVFIFWIISQLIHPFFSNLKNIEKILTKDLIEWLIDAMRIVVLILGFCAVLELWGIRVGAIIAGLGLLGVAVALGAQDLFKNLISGILVLVEKRFKKGDVIEVDNVIAGVVEKIGFRSTAVRKFDKSLCYIPNNQFAENAVTNISQISNRRINWIIGLEYKSTSKQLKKICSEIEMVIKKNKKDFYVSENTQVIVKINEFSASSIDILVRCFTTSNDYNRLVEIKDKLAINIKDVVEKSGCSFAFPSQSLYIEKNQT
jgi:MscS family membrane protein